MHDKSFFKGKTILITGGTGSFGRCLAKRLLTEDECLKVIILSRDEWKQWEMRESEPIYRHSKIRYFLGDVRDKSRLERAFSEVNFVVHAAALKQVPAAEYNPSEFIKTNVNGAMNVIDAAIMTGVEKVITLSTDKAVNPINLYGATKLCSDKLFVAGNSYVGSSGFPKFAVVRYGNVLASRGSVIPLWKKMVEDGAVTIPITDERMTRFWITLDQAVEFVLVNFQRMRGAEIYIPKIPSMRILDLAKAIAPGLKYQHLGIREGEKLHEVMFGAEDSRHTMEYDDHYMIVPEMYTHNSTFIIKYLEDREGETVPENFAYASNTNQKWIEVDQLRHLIEAH